MVLLARCIGAVIMGMGLTIAINPAMFKAMLNFWKTGNRVYVAGVMRLIFGAIFLMAAPHCRLSGVVTILGILVIIGGIMIFVIGPKRILPIFAWWETKPPMVMRFMGLVAVSIGALVLYSI